MSYLLKLTNITKRVTSWVKPQHLINSGVIIFTKKRVANRAKTSKIYSEGYNIPNRSNQQYL